MGDLGFPRSVVRAVEPDFQAQIAEVREAGLNIMMSMKGDGKPISFIEDRAVPLEDLADYTEATQRGLRAARRARDLVRPCVGRLPARAPGPQHEGPGRRHADALHCRGMFRSRPPVQGLAQRRARRRRRAERIQRADVRSAHRPRLRDGQGRVRPEGPAQSQPDRPRAALRRPVAVPLCAGLWPDRGLPAAPRLVGPSGAFGRSCSAPSRCATTTAIAASSTPA